MKRASYHPNPKGYRDNLVEIFTAIDGGDFTQAASIIEKYGFLSQETLSKAGLNASGIDLGLLGQAVNNLNRQQSDRAKKALVQFDSSICDALDNQNFISKAINCRNH